MELYIPPPSAFLPRVQPPRPVVPQVPLVPPPDLPDVIYAPEGPYTLNKEFFPPIGNPTPPLSSDIRTLTPSASSFGGGPGFIMPPPGSGPGGLQPGQTAMSYQSSIVNGQTQPAWSVKMSWVNVWFPPKTGDKGFAGMLGKGGGGGGTNRDPGTMPSQMPGYEASASSDSSSVDLAENPPVPMEVPLSALPPGASRKGMPFGKTIATGSLPRPKNNLRSSNSSFVTRLQAFDGLPKFISEKGKGGGEMARWGFWNLGRTFGWGEEGGKLKEPLARVTFSQVPTSHAVSALTAGPDRLDIVVGFASGDLVWLDFIIGRYTRINKGGLLNSNPVTSVNFDPRQPHLFIVAFSDDTLLQMNVFAEDPVLTTQQNSPMPWTTFFDRQHETQVPVSPVSGSNGAAGNGPGNANGSANTDAKGSTPQNDGEVFEDAFILWKNEETAAVANNKKELSPWAGRNPTAACKIGRKSLSAMAYSPDGRWLSTVSDDGMMRLIDVAEERLTDTFAGHFGSLNCVAWSPDSKFVAVGGQDDLISIFSARESRVVARCQGHSAFVTGICFDPLRGDGRGYRFGSVGEDGKLVLWDFTAASLHRPRHHVHPGNLSHHRLEAGSTLSLAGQSRSHLPLDVSSTGGHYHPAPPKNEVALLQPVLARLVEGNLLTSVHISHVGIVTISRAALFKFWQRPPRQTATSGRQREKTPARESAREGRELRNPRERETAVAA